MVDGCEKKSRGRIEWKKGPGKKPEKEKGVERPGKKKWERERKKRKKRKKKKGGKSPAYGFRAAP
ncbi:MAG: hypothetical protein QXH42_07305 [Thermoplasmata archaeon]